MGPTISNALRAMASLTMAAVLTVASTSADA
ncbi:MAG TPA: cell envelope biogenesis protein OmpA, partial [Sulfitobacter sp.]|nr:cell envelope biogenesis protein OmpA [Sulfitobacter sp.]